MDRTERCFRLGYEGLLVAVSISALRWLGVNWSFTVLASLAIAHSILWITYGEKFVALKNLGLKISPKAEVDNYLIRLKASTRALDYLSAVVVSGSYAENRYRESSDVDVRVLRRHGVVPGFRACLWALRQRTSCTFRRIPLDLLIIDAPAKFRQVVPDPRVLILVDRDQFIANHYAASRMEDS